MQPATAPTPAPFTIYKGEKLLWEEWDAALTALGLGIAILVIGIVLESWICLLGLPVLVLGAITLRSNRFYRHHPTLRLEAHVLELPHPSRPITLPPAQVRRIWTRNGIRWHLECTDGRSFPVVATRALVEELSHRSGIPMEGGHGGL